MSKEENSGKKWIWCLVILVCLFIALLVFYNLYLRHLKSINNWQEVILSFSPIIILFLIGYGIVLAGSLRFSNNKMKLQCGALLIVEIISIVALSISKIYNNHLILTLMAIIISVVTLAIVFLASTKFFYTEPECWRKRMWANIEEWLSNLDNPFDKFLLWSALFLILLSLVLARVVILCSNPSNKSWCEFLVNLITNKDLFEWTFNLFLFTFFSLIISILGNLFVERKANTEDSEFLFYMISVKALIIGALVLIIVYALTRTFILNVIQYSSNLYIYKNHLLPCCIDKHIACVNSVGNSNMLFWISIYYAIFITVYYYFLKKFFEVINFAMPAHRLQMKIKVLSRSPLNKNTLRLWNAFWRDEKFGDALKEGAFLSDFVPKIVYHKKYFQLKDQVSVAADALRGFSENIDKRYSEALAREVLNIVPRRDAHPDMLLDYLVDALNAYKDIVCYDKLVCEEPNFKIFFYKLFFKDEANRFLPKYQYLDELIYQILFTLRKSIEKLRNDKYFEKHDESRRVLCEKFNDFIKEIMDLKCDNKLESALKTESAKKWIKEAGNLLEEVADNNKDINVNNNRSTLTPNFTKAVQELKNGKIDTDALKKVLEKWTEICK